MCVCMCVGVWVCARAEARVWGMRVSKGPSFAFNGRSCSKKVERRLHRFQLGAVSGQLEERLARFRAEENELFMCVHLLEGSRVQRKKHVGIAYIANRSVSS